MRKENEQLTNLQESPLGDRYHWVAMHFGKEVADAVTGTPGHSLSNTPTLIGLVDGAHLACVGGGSIRLEGLTSAPETAYHLVKGYFVGPASFQVLELQKLER